MQRGKKRHDSCTYCVIIGEIATAMRAEPNGEQPRVRGDGQVGAGGRTSKVTMGVVGILTVTMLRIIRGVGPPLERGP